MQLVSLINLIKIIFLLCFCLFSNNILASEKNLKIIKDQFDLAFPIQDTFKSTKINFIKK